MNQTEGGRFSVHSEIRLNYYVFMEYGLLVSGFGMQGASHWHTPIVTIQQLLGYIRSRTFVVRLARRKFQHPPHRDPSSPVGEILTCSHQDLALVRIPSRLLVQSHRPSSPPFVHYAIVREPLVGVVLSD